MVESLKNNPTPIEFHTDLKLLQLDPDKCDRGKGAENIQCEYQGDPMEIGFNSRFLREMIENIDADTIRMSFSKPQRAALIAPTAQHDENEDVLMLIMPVMLN